MTGEWVDPGYCIHGVTVGARCTRCGGTAHLPDEGVTA